MWRHSLTPFTSAFVSFPPHLASISWQGQATPGGRAHFVWHTEFVQRDVGGSKGWMRRVRVRVRVKMRVEAEIIGVTGRGHRGPLLLLRWKGETATGQATECIRSTYSDDCARARLGAGSFFVRLAATGFAFSLPPPPRPLPPPTPPWPLPIALP